MGAQHNFKTMPTLSPVNDELFANVLIISVLRGDIMHLLCTDMCCLKLVLLPPQVAPIQLLVPSSPIADMFYTATEGSHSCRRLHQVQLAPLLPLLAMPVRFSLCTLLQTATLTMVKNPFKKFLDPDDDTDQHQNVTDCSVGYKMHYFELCCYQTNKQMLVKTLPLALVELIKWYAVEHGWQ